MSTFKFRLRILDGRTAKMESSIQNMTSRSPPVVALRRAQVLKVDCIVRAFMDKSSASGCSRTRGHWQLVQPFRTVPLPSQAQAVYGSLAILSKGKYS